MKLPAIICSCLLGLFVWQTASAQDEPRTIHVFVALCDNANQGIAPVPAKIGNGQAPDHNLYWGAAYGVRTFFRKHHDWELLLQEVPDSPEILERVVFRHRHQAVYLVADAYDGARIQSSIEDFFQACSGNQGEMLCVAGEEIASGGQAKLLAYVGHNGLMEFRVPDPPPALYPFDRQAIILSCVSRDYFAPQLRQTKAEPLLWTTGLMAPEAYTLSAAMDAWIKERPDEEIQQAAAAAYHQYQKCGLRGASRLLVSGYRE